MGIEEYGQAPPQKKEEKEVTVKDILVDKKQSALFGEFINTKPDKAGEPKGSEVAERLIKGESTSEDIKVLAEQKDNFLKQQKEVQRVSKALTPDLLKRLAGQSPTLETLVKVGGIEGVRTAVVSQLEMLAMKEPKRFGNMVEAYDHLIEKTSQINMDIESVCNENNINVDEYLKILENPDKFGREHALFQKIHGQMSFIKRQFEKGVREAATKATHLNRKDDIDSLKKEYDLELETVGGLLAASISENKDINEAFMKALLSEKAPEKEQAGGFREMRGIMPSDEDLKKEWEKEEAKGTTKDDFKKNYLSSFENNIGGNKGTWPDIITRFTKEAIDKIS